MIDLHFAAADAFTGLFIGLTGVGGGALMTPILLLVFSGLADDKAVMAGQHYRVTCFLCFGG